MILRLIAVAVFAYLLGSINGAIITSKYFFKKDIRKFGSGNPGLTNFYRVFGKRGVLMVVAIDILKTVVPVLVGGWLLGRFDDARYFGCEIAGLFAMLGHAFPIYYKFQGGKTVMAAGTLLICLDWRVALVSWGIFILVVALTRYVSLGAVLCAIPYPFTVAIFGTGSAAEIIVAALSAALLIWRHKANIARLLKGQESKLSFSRNK